MSERVALLHTTINAVEPMVTAVRRHAPHLEPLHFLDESFVVGLLEAGELTPELADGFARYVGRAVEAGVAGVLLSCSSFSPVVPALDDAFTVPVVSVDGAMLDEAVNRGARIGLVATVASSLSIAREALQQRAQAAGRRIQVQGQLAGGAFAALQDGDGAEHDRQVRQAAAGLAADVEIIVLAQISMSRAAPALAELPVPVLTSADTSVRALLKRLEKQAADV